MTPVDVFAKCEGEEIWIQCPGYVTPDGCFWNCAHCSSLIIRASFGQMNGVYRCQCGAEITLLVDNQVVDIRELNGIRAPGAAQPVNDKDFLRDCGIATEEKTQNG